MKTIRLIGLVGALALAHAPQALAHAKLVRAEPAADAASAAPRQLVLHFNEKVAPKFSGVELAAPGGALVKVATSVGKDGLTLVAVPAKPLAPGAYKVTWHAVTADAHRMQGSYSFTVR